MAALEQLARVALKHYVLPQDVRVELLNLSENAMFRLQDSAGRAYVLRVHRAGYHSPQAIASELAWARALREDQVVITPTAIAGTDGQFIQQVSHPGLTAPRNVVLFHWEPGTEPAITDDLTAHVATLGATAARMHQHARRWQRPPHFTRHVWDFATSLGEDRPHWGRWRDAIGLTPDGTRLFERTVSIIGRRLADYGKGPDRFGLIHADLRLANLLIDGDTVKVIDFDDCGFGWYMYDAATVISFYEHDAQAPDLIESWKAGYRSVAPIAREDEDMVPTLIMLRRLLLTAWIASHIEADFPRSLGRDFTIQGLTLCEDYLRVYC